MALVDLEWKSNAGFHGIRFVYIPGTDSAFEHNTLTTMEWMPKLGAAIMAISSSQPLSEQDLHLLKDMRKYTPEIAVLVTKADLVTSEQLHVIMDFVQTQMVQHRNIPVAVYTYSTLPGFESLCEHFQQDILKRIAEQSEEEHDTILQYKLKRLTEDCAQYLRLALVADRAQEAARNELQSLLRQEAADAVFIRHELDQQLPEQYGGLHHLTTWYAQWLVELEEFIRKNDYRFIKDGFGKEGNSWLRAVKVMVGIKDVF